MAQNKTKWHPPNLPTSSSKHKPGVISLSYLFLTNPLHPTKSQFLTFVFSLGFSFQYTPDSLAQMTHTYLPCLLTRQFPSLLTALFTLQLGLFKCIVHPDHGVIKTQSLPGNSLQNPSMASYHHMVFLEEGMYWNLFGRQFVGDLNLSTHTFLSYFHCYLRHKYGLSSQCSGVKTCS